MGKYMSTKDNVRTGDVAAVVMDHHHMSSSSLNSNLGVRTRAKTLLLQRENRASGSESTSYIQLRSRRLEKVSVGKSKESSLGPNRSRRFSVQVEMVDSGVEKYGAIEVSSDEDDVELVGTIRDAPEVTPCCMVLDSDVAGTMDVCSSTPHRNLDVAYRTGQTATRCRNAPSTDELEEFFSGAEQLHQKLFSEKYNFDVVSDCPLPGRYEWVRST